MVGVLKTKITIHLAKRSEKLYDFPGLYDNLVAGGQLVYQFTKI